MNKPFLYATSAALCWPPGAHSSEGRKLNVKNQDSSPDRRDLIVVSSVASRVAED